MRNSLSQYMLVLGIFIGLAVPASGQYESLKDVVSDIQGLASGSGGDATASPLKNGVGVVIVTDGVDTNVPIWLLKISKYGSTTNNKILITGTQHAREWVAYRAVLEAADFILDNKNSTSWPAGDSRFDYFKKFKEMNIKYLTDNTEIYVVPIVNPEGYYYSKEVNQDDQNAPKMGGWRKNRRDVSSDPAMTGEPTQGTDADTMALMPFIGVDLNRNYPSTDWGAVTYDIYGRETTSRTRWEYIYCGLPNGSLWSAPIRPPIAEKETGAVVTLSTNKNFDCQIDVHSFGGTVGWVQSADSTNQNVRSDGGFDDQTVFQILGAKAATLIEDPSGTSYVPEASPYPTSGDTLVWQYENTGKKSLTFLIEIGKSLWVGEPYNTKFAPTNATEHAESVLPGQLFMMFSTVDKSFASKPTARFRKP